MIDNRMPSNLRNVDINIYPYKCDICNRPLKRKIKAYGNIYCQKHYNQFKKYGKCLDDNPRCLLDLNEIYIKDNIAYMELYDINCNIITNTLLDVEDINKIKYIKWSLSHGYVSNRNKKNKNILLHKLILNTDQFVDHINHNTLDNRKCNLRIVTKSQNQMNSNYKGVTMKNNKYYAYIKLNGKLLNLGYYNDIEEALFARWYGEQLLFKEYKYPKDKPIILLSREKEIMEYVDKKVQRL